MKLAELFQPWISTSIPECDIVGIQNDSRQVKKGDVFLAYPGAMADGRLFVEKAIQSGAAAIAYDPAELPENFYIPTYIPGLPISKLNQQLGAIANRFFDFPSHSMHITGITGTNGKTTIAYQLAQAYELLGKASAYIGTIGHGHVNALKPLNNTTPDAIQLQEMFFQYKKNHVEQVCMEVSSHALHQKRVDGIQFKQAVFTNLSHEHLDYHHSMEAYAAAKGELFAKNSLQSAVINYDDEFTSFMLEKLSKSCKALTYGLHKGADIRAVELELKMTGSNFKLESPWGHISFSTSLLGSFNVYNTLAIAGCLLASEISPHQVCAVIGKLKAAPGRMEVVAQNPCVIVDYAHTPDALKNVLSALKKLKNGKLIVVFGCGGDRDKAKRPLMGQIAAEYGDILVVTSDNPRTEHPEKIMEEIEVGISAHSHYLKIMDRELAIKKALAIADSQDIILIAGKGHEAYQQIGKEKFSFSDQAVVAKYLNALFI